MHIVEGQLPPIWAAFWYLVALPIIVYGALKLIKLLREKPELKITVALSGAFIFVLSALKLPSVTGSSSHPTGTGLSSALYGPAITAVLSTIVLLFQALLLAHGGHHHSGCQCSLYGYCGAGSRLCGIQNDEESQCGDRSFDVCHGGSCRLGNLHCHCFPISACVPR